MAGLSLGSTQRSNVMEDVRIIIAMDQMAEGDGSGAVLV